MEKGKIIVVTAPSGSGKTTIVRSLLKEFSELVFSVSATTRQKRDVEIDGKDYFFIDEAKFTAGIEKKEFIEWEKVYGYYYGTYRYFVENTINSGKIVILELEVNGALAIKKIYNEAILIYIVPPDIDELIKRLRNRRTETEEDFQKRIERAKMELSLKDKFDYLVPNHDLEEALNNARALIKKLIIKD